MFRWANRLRGLLIANPKSNRVSLFCEALARAGLPLPTVLSHERLLCDPDALLALDERPTWVKLDALGKSRSVEALLLNRGWKAGVRVASARQVEERAQKELLAPHQAHAGFLCYVEGLRARATERPAWLWLTNLRALPTLFSKRQTIRALIAETLPTTVGLPPLRSSDALRQAMTERSWRQVIVKLDHGSSAVGTTVLTRREDDSETAWSTLVQRGSRWFASRRLQRYDRPRDIEECLDFALDAGAYVERLVSKLRQDRMECDLRVICTAGVPDTFVVRRSSHPLTNLHLGATRGSVEQLERRVGARAWRSMKADCRRAAAVFGGLQLSFDILWDRQAEGHRFIEANAFGDLFPSYAPDGLSTYDRQARAIRALSQARQHDKIAAILHPFTPARPR